MLRETPPSEHGAIILESVFVVIIVALILSFIIDAGVVLYRYSTLSDTTSSVTHELAIELGRAWHNNQINSAPWNGSCNSFLRKTGGDLVAKKLEQFSFEDNSALFYLGRTLDNSTALVSDPAAPYAILRIVGDLKPSCIFCNFLPHLEVTTESSVLVEYHEKACNDY